MRAAAIIAAGALLAAAYVVTTRRQELEPPEMTLLDEPPEIFEEVISTVKNISTNVHDAVRHPNVRAFLMMIRTGEGTTGPDGYRTIVGGSTFASFADHPRQLKSGVFRNGTAWSSTAAGAYQFLARTWDEMRSMYNLPDFSPASQDIAAVGLIKRRGALADVLAGRFTAAIGKCAREWASLPGSPYGQPTISMARALAVLQAEGAQV